MIALEVKSYSESDPPEVCYVCSTLFGMKVAVLMSVPVEC